MSNDLSIRIFRGDIDGGEMVDYSVPREPGMVVLDAVHSVEALHAPDLAVRWNCKAGKCGSCGAEVNGRPKLMCMDRLDNYSAEDAIEIRPMKTFPLVKDLVVNVAFNYEKNAKIAAFKPADDKEINYLQPEADRIMEFRKCIECFLCQDVCHVLRDHNKKEEFSGPRFFVRLAGLEMHPSDTDDRLPFAKEEMGIGYCNITKCCTEVCPENIQITDNAIIPVKERIVDRYYDPVLWLWRKITGKK